MTSNTLVDAVCHCHALTLNAAQAVIARGRMSTSIGALRGRECVFVLSLIIFFLTLNAAPFAAQHEQQAVTVNKTADDQSASIHRLDDELADLQRKVAKPPKDEWDKLSALSPLISGVVVALIGLYATTLYNRRQRDNEQRMKAQEVTISQIQTVETFIPHLSSTNESVKKLLCSQSKLSVTGT